MRVVYISSYKTQINMLKRYHKARVESLKRKLSRALESLNDSTPHLDSFELLLDVYKYIDTITFADLENK